MRRRLRRHRIGTCLRAGFVLVMVLFSSHASAESREEEYFRYIEKCYWRAIQIRGQIPAGMMSPREIGMMGEVAQYQRACAVKSQEYERKFGYTVACKLTGDPVEPASCRRGISAQENNRLNEIKKAKAAKEERARAIKMKAEEEANRKEAEKFERLASEKEQKMKADKAAKEALWK